MKIIRWSSILVCILIPTNLVFAQMENLIKPTKINMFPVKNLPSVPTIQILAPPPPFAAVLPSEKPFLKNKFVYIYNFLDIRDQNFGQKMIDQFDEQIKISFSENSINSKILRFKNSSVGDYYSPTQSTPVYAPFGYHTQDSTVIPVNEVISSNQIDEAASGASYRLIEFPASFTQNGVWQLYDIRYTLIDIKSNVKIWSFTIHGEHLNLLRADEGSKHRAKKTIEAMIMNLRSSGLM